MFAPSCEATSIYIPQNDDLYSREAGELGASDLPDQRLCNDKSAFVLASRQDIDVLTVDGDLRGLVAKGVYGVQALRERR